MGTVLLVAGWVRILSEIDGTLRAALITYLALNTDISHVHMMHLELSRTPSGRLFQAQLRPTASLLRHNNLLSDPWQPSTALKSSASYTFPCPTSSSWYPTRT